MDKPRLWLDCETTRLDHDRKPWDVAGILRPAGGNRADDQEFQWFVDIADLDLATADLKSLDVGRFWTRHPQAHIGADRDGRRGPSAGAAAVRRPEVCCPVRRHGQRFGGQ